MRGYSLDSQVKLLTGYCENKAFKVVKEFKIAESASKELGRKVFHELLDYINHNNVTHLAVEKTDRLTRNMRDAVVINDWLEADPLRKLHLVKENIMLEKDSKSDVKFMWSIHLAVAKKYTDNLREEAMKGWAEKLAQGWLPSVPPPGYMTVTDGGKRIHVPDPETRPLILQAFKKYLEPGESIKSVTEYMKAIGVRTRWGRPQTKSNVQLMLLNPFYVGINRFNGNDYPGAQEQIIPKAIYRRVQDKLKGGRPRLLAKHNSPLKGLIRCVDCGSVVTWQKQKAHYYGSCRRLSDGCKKTKLLRQDNVETLVLTMLEQLVCPSEAVIAWVADSAQRQHKDDIENREKLVASIRQQMDRIGRMEDRLYDDKLAGEISQSKYEEKHGHFMKEKTELNERLEKMDQSGGR